MFSLVKRYDFTLEFRQTLLSSLSCSGMNVRLHGNLPPRLGAIPLQGAAQAHEKRSDTGRTASTGGAKRAEIHLKQLRSGTDYWTSSV